ncbi:MAG: YciI family protein [Pseudomonadota bacterium]
MKKEKLFIIIVKYIVDLEIVAQHRDAHLEYLDKYYAKRVFLASGRQNPRFGGVIIAKATSREKLYEILAQDPFHQHLCAEYQAIEFEPNKGTKGFKEFLQESSLDLFNIK